MEFSGKALFRATADMVARMVIILVFVLGSVGLAKVLAISPFWFLVPVLVLGIISESRVQRSCPETWIFRDQPAEDLVAGLSRLPKGTKVRGTLRFPERTMFEQKDGSFVVEARS